MQENMILINDTELTIKEYSGQRVVTFKDIDTTHERRTGTADKNFRANKDKFIEGKDYYYLKFNQNPEIRGFKIAPRGITVFTHSGYLMLVKSFTDDLSWQKQRMLVDNYFNPQPHAEPMELAKQESTIPGNMYDGIRLMLDKMQEHDTDIQVLKDKNREYDNNIAILEKEVRAVKKLANKKPKEIIVESKPVHYKSESRLPKQSLFTISAIAESFGLSGHELNKLLYLKGIICPYNKGWVLNDRIGNDGFIILKDATFMNKDGVKETIAMTYWTQAGTAYLSALLRNSGYVQVKSVNQAKKKSKKSKKKKK